MLKKILIAEDDAIVAQDLRAILEKNGYTVTDIVIDGRAAIESCKLNPPDLVLMDIILRGDLSGVETAILIQAAGTQVPVVFLTGFPRKEFLRLSRPTTFQYLNKPFDEEELLGCIRSIFGTDEPAEA